MSSSKFIYSNKKESGSSWSKAEDPRFLGSIGRKSARSALRENQKLGYSVTYIHKSRVIQEDSSGHKKVIKRGVTRSHTPNVSKGDVICVNND